MLLSRNQNRSWPLVTEGHIDTLLNCRPDRYGNFSPVPLPQKIVETHRRVLGIDRRGEERNLISIDNAEADGTLYIEGSFDEYDTFTPLNEPVTMEAGNVVEMAPCGDFLICRRSDGSLFFLRWEEDSSEYIPLGTLPEEPSFTLSRISQGTSTYAVPSVDFAKPVADLRSGLPDDARKRISSAVTKAWRDAVTSCNGAAMFLQPVTVRVALRLFDGSLFSLSDAIRVPGADWQGYDRFLLSPVMNSSNEATGTAATSFSLEPYRLQLTLDDFSSPVWNSLFSAVEIYVETEQDVLAGDDCSVTFSPQSNAVSVYLDTRSRTELDTLLGNGSYVKVITTKLPVATPLEFGPITHPLPNSSTPSLTNSSTPMTAEADVLLSHGPFLHLAVGSKLITTAPSNPLAKIAVTETGSRIRALAAMPSGGGAYTRQYLYLCTDHGIYALTCDRDGNHTNCRPVSPHRVSDSQRLVASDDSVYALTDSGTLLRLRNANPETIFRALPYFVGLAWDADADELWLSAETQVGGETSLIIQLSAPGAAYCRSVAADYVVPQSGKMMYKYDGAVWLAPSYTEYMDRVDKFEHAEVSMTLPAPIGRYMMFRGAALGPMDLSLMLKAENETLARTAMPGECDSRMMVTVATSSSLMPTGGRRTFALPFAAPDTWQLTIEPTRYRVTFTGRWHMLETPRITSHRWE